MLSRRGILGAFLAAPAIIRTPGLLMAVRKLPEVGPSAISLPQSYDGFVYSGFYTLVPVNSVSEKWMEKIIHTSLYMEDGRLLKTYHA